MGEPLRGVAAGGIERDCGCLSKIMGLHYLHQAIPALMISNPDYSDGHKSTINQTEAVDWFRAPTEECQADELEYISTSPTYKVRAEDVGCTILFSPVAWVFEAKSPTAG
jgi:hypothetical protein